MTLVSSWSPLSFLLSPLWFNPLLVSSWFFFLVLLNTLSTCLFSYSSFSSSLINSIPCFFWFCLLLLLNTPSSYLLRLFFPLPFPLEFASLYDCPLDNPSLPLSLISLHSLCVLFILLYSRYFTSFLVCPLDNSSSSWFPHFPLEFIYFLACLLHIFTFSS